MTVLRRVFEKRAAALGFLRSHSSVSGGSSSSTYNGCAASRIARPPMLLLSHISDDSAGVAYKLHSLGGGDSILNLEKKRSGADEFHDLEIVGSAHGWIALHNRRNDGVLLSNPLSGQQVKLPPLHTLSDPLGGGGGVVSRVALSDNGHRAVIVAGRARRLAFCEPGLSTEWTQIGEDLYCGDGVAKPRGYEDAVYSRRHKRFYCVTRVGTELEGWSLENPQSPKIEWRAAVAAEFVRPCSEFDRPLSHAHGLMQQCWDLKYLVFAEEREQLFLVVRHVNSRLGSEPVYYSKYRGGEYCYPYKTHGFDVYKIHLDGRVEYVEDSLDGLAMVVGMSQSSAYEAAGSALEPDSVYFSDERRLMRLSQSEVHNDYGGHDNGIFDYKSKSFSACSCSNDDCPLAPAPPYAECKADFKLSGLWICIIWVLWKWRNEVTFRGAEWDLKRIEVEIRCRFWSWCVAHGEADPLVTFSGWATNTLAHTWHVK